MKKDDTQEQQATHEEQEVISRREYLVGLKKWSKAVIGGVLLGGAFSGATEKAEAGAWINNRGNWGNGWTNRGGGSAWINNRGGWGNNGNWSNHNPGGSWANRSGGGWVDRHPGGGSWNNRGGGNWVNRSY